MTEIKQILDLIFGDDLCYVSYETIEKLAKQYAELEGVE